MCVRWDIGDVSAADCDVKYTCLGHGRSHCVLQLERQDSCGLLEVRRVESEWLQWKGKLWNDCVPRAVTCNMANTWNCCLEGEFKSLETVQYRKKCILKVIDCSNSVDIKDIGSCLKREKLEKAWIKRDYLNMNKTCLNMTKKINLLNLYRYNAVVVKRLVPQTQRRREW
jgi:hypothetical protein